MPDPPVLVSACLLGLNTRYDGANRKNEELLARLAGRWIIPVCPEQLGGMPTPRPPSCLNGATGEQVLDGRCRIENAAGRDVTQEFVRGANEVLLIVRTFGVEEAYLKTKSPSCGLGGFHGVCAALLLRNGVRVEAVD